MKIERNVAVAVDAERLLERVGRRRREAFRPLVASLLAEMAGLVDPAFVWTVADVRRLGDGTVDLARGGLEGSLSIGPRWRLLEGASQVALALATIGPGLEERVRVLLDEDPPKAAILDGAGTLALEALTARLFGDVEGWARSLRLGTGPALLPGSLEGWSVEGQREIAAFLDPSSIGVSLSPQALLRPFKSLSLAVGLGPGFGGDRIGSLCGDCRLRESCLWRRRG